MYVCMCTYIHVPTYIHPRSNLSRCSCVHVYIHTLVVCSKGRFDQTHTNGASLKKWRYEIRKIPIYNMINPTVLSHMHDKTWELELKPTVTGYREILTYVCISTYMKGNDPSTCKNKAPRGLSWRFKSSMVAGHVLNAKLLRCPRVLVMVVG